MRTTITLILGGIFIFATHAVASDEIHSFKNTNVGKVMLITPNDWRPVEQQHDSVGTSFYDLLPPQKGQFDLEIQVNDLAHMRMATMIDKDLEIYIQSRMASAVPQSIEGKASAIRFGTKRDGVYVRLTDKAPKPGEFILLTQGIRIQGNKAVLFTLYSNDKDETVLQKTLQIVESVQFEH